MHADLILRNGTIHTLVPGQGPVRALAVRAGRVLAAGPDQEILGYAGPGTRTIDLAGSTAVPGFIDSHVHLLSYGQTLIQLDLAPVRSIARLQELVREQAAALPDGAWVLGRGWDQEVFAEGRYPSRHDLDAAAPGRPVLLRRACGHACVASSRALELAGVTGDTPDPEGGVIDRDASGQPTGVFRETASRLVAAAVPSPGPDEVAEALERGIRSAVAAGVTGIHTNDGFEGGFSAGWDMYSRVLYGRDLALRVYWDVPVADLEEILATPKRTGSGDERFKLGSVKLFIDGSLGASTALLSCDYSDAPGNRGVRIMETAMLQELVLLAHAAGMQVAIHAIGDLGIQMCLDAIEQAQKVVPRVGRHRIIHCQIMRPELFSRFARLGVVADVQPKFVTTDLRWTDRRVGPERVKFSYAWKTFLDSGVALAAGSDCPVEPIEPLLGLYAAVNRQDLDGHPAGGWLPEQKLTVHETLRAFTTGSAFAAFEEDIKGTLAPGKLADVVVLDADPYLVPAPALKDLQVQMTIIGGKPVYGD
ncbi:MAG: amidohydrolase [Bacillota bacterium]